MNKEAGQVCFQSIDREAPYQTRKPMGERRVKALLHSLMSMNRALWKVKAVSVKLNRKSLECKRFMFWGIGRTLYCKDSWIRKSFYVCHCIDAIFTATTSMFENIGTTPLLGTFPDSLTKLPVICLHMFRNFANIAYRLCIWYLFIKSMITFNLLNINNIHNLLYIDLLSI